MIAGPRLRIFRVLIASLTTTTVTASLLTIGGSPAPAVPVLPQAAARTALDERSALAQARALNERVEVMDERTELSQVFAEADARLVYEATADPKRLRRSDGSWADVNLELIPGPGGTLRPRASVSDVRFSAGGNAPLVTAVRKGRTFTLDLPGRTLRAPTVSGDTATYANVLPDVDLAVRATPTGFSHVLKVKTAAAAANADLRAITFDLGGDARVQRLRDGALSAVADDVLVASAPAPAMWDSRTAVATARTTSRALSAEPSTPNAPGDAARVAPVATEVTPAGDLVLKPDAGMLAGNATFPLYIDPAWSTGRSRWAYATHNNTSNSDTSRARVGSDPDGRIYRSFFEFPVKSIAGRHIESAYVHMNADHTYSCDYTETSMYHAASFSGTPRTAYSTKLLKWVSSASSHANEGTGCEDSPQDDMPVNFRGGPVTSMLQGAVDKGNATVTVGFSARDQAGREEGDKFRWKKFFIGSATLIADVNAKPGKPHTLHVNGVACTSAGIRIGVTNPYFSAIFPDGDRSQAITGTWEWYEVTATGGTGAKKTAPGRTSAPAGYRGTTARVSGAENNKRYMVRVTGTDPAPYAIDSKPSDWCYFTVDTSVPQMSVTEVSAPAGPGEPGEYLLSSTSPDTVTFTYGWEGLLLRSVPAGSVPGVAGKAARVTVTAPRYGLNTLHGEAVDATGNRGYDSEESFVDRVKPAVARWLLETSPRVDETAALADHVPAEAGDTPLLANNVGWTPDARLVGGRSARLNGSASLSAAGPVVNTSASFSVSTWVRLGALPTTVDMAAASQQGGETAGFVLGTRLMGSPATPRWAFTMRDTNALASAARTAYSATPLTSADVGGWAHLVGVYDKAAGQVRLYVNGVMVGEAARTAVPWSATGPFTVGHSFANGAPVNRFTGEVADARVFDRVVVGHDFTGQRSSDEESTGIDADGQFLPVEMGRWAFDEAWPCFDPAVEGTCEAVDGTPWGRRLRLSQGSDMVATSRGQAASFDDTYFPEFPDDPLSGTATHEYGKSQRNIAPPGESADWQDAPVLRTDRSFTVSVRVKPDEVNRTMTALAPRGNKQSGFYLGSRNSTVGGVTATRFEAMTVTADADLGETYRHLIAPTPLDVSDDGQWSFLTLVFEAPTKTLTLYVNGMRAAAPQTQTTLWNATGPLLVGSSWYTGDGGTPGFTDRWFGSVDDILVHQGAMSAAQVGQLYDRETPSEF